MQPQVTLVSVAPVTVPVKVIAWVTMTLSGAVIVPFGVTETVTTFPVLLPPPQPDSTRAEKTTAVRRVFSVPNFVLTSTPTNAIRATEPPLFSLVFSNPNFSVAVPLTPAILPFH